MPRQFTMPVFTRQMWANEAARFCWQPRMERIAAAWPRLELLSVAKQVRPAAICTVHAKDWEKFSAECKALGLQIEPLTLERARKDGALSMQTAVGRKREVKMLALAWEKQRHAEIGRALGYPECCCEFYAEAMMAGDSDAAWLAAQHTAGMADAAIVELKRQPGQTNIFLRAVGVAAIPHTPCRFDCAASKELADAMAAMGGELEFADEVAWAAEILQWPLEWSALHGIAEIKTPVMKISTNAPMRAGKQTVRWHGELYPAEGAQGVGFPYRQDRNTAAAKFTEGLTVLPSK